MTQEHSSYCKLELTEPQNSQYKNEKTLAAATGLEEKLFVLNLYAVHH